MKVTWVRSMSTSGAQRARSVGIAECGHLLVAGHIESGIQIRPSSGFLQRRRCNVGGDSSLAMGHVLCLRVRHPSTNFEPGS